MSYDTLANIITSFPCTASSLSFSYTNSVESFAPTSTFPKESINSTSPSLNTNWQPLAVSGHDHQHVEDCNCHAQHIHRGSISGGTNLEAAQKLDPILRTGESSTTSDPHSRDTANKVTCCVDSDLSHCSPNAQEDGRSGNVPHRGTEPPTYANHGEDGSGCSSSTDHTQSQSLNTTAPSYESQVTKKPLMHNFLASMDPRVNHKGVKQTRSSGA